MREGLIDLRRADVGCTTRLLQAEGREWQRRLHWDRTGFCEMASRLARRRRLPGLLLMSGGEGAGKVLLGEDGASRSLEFPYVDPARRGRGLLAKILERGIEQVQAAPSVERIEIGFFPFDEESPEDLMRAKRFVPQPRDYMVHTLSTRGPAAEVGALDGLRFDPWPVNQAPLAEILNAAYAGQPDSVAAEFYRSVAGCAAYLETLVASDECGMFSADLSCVARTPAGRVAGFLLGTVIADDTAHVAQIAVAPDGQGRGTGRALLGRFHRRARAAGLVRSTLLVTRANERARSWYERCGYRSHLPFLAYWWEPSR